MASAASTKEYFKTFSPKTLFCKLLIWFSEEIHHEAAAKTQGLHKVRKT